MTTPTLYPIYTVDADRQTGEWIGEPQPTGEMMDRIEFLSLDTDDDTHRDAYMEFLDDDTDDDTHHDTFGVTGQHMRLILITWVDD